MDPLNQGRGVLQFKSALKAVLMVRDANALRKDSMEANCIYLFYGTLSEISSWVSLPYIDAHVFVWPFSLALKFVRIVAVVNSLTN